MPKQHRAPSSPSPWRIGASAEPGRHRRQRVVVGLLLEELAGWPGAQPRGRRAFEQRAFVVENRRALGPVQQLQPDRVSAPTVTIPAPAVQRPGPAARRRCGGRSGSVRSVPGWRSIPPVRQPRPSCPGRNRRRASTTALEARPCRRRTCQPGAEAAGKACREGHAAGRPENGDPDGDHCRHRRRRQAGRRRTGPGGPSSVTLRCCDSPPPGAPLAARRNLSAGGAVATSGTVARQQLGGAVVAGDNRPTASHGGRTPRRQASRLGRHTADQRCWRRMPRAATHRGRLPGWTPQPGPPPHPGQADRRRGLADPGGPAARRRRRSPAGRSDQSARGFAGDDRQVQTVVVGHGAGRLGCSAPPAHPDLLGSFDRTGPDCHA